MCRKNYNIGRKSGPEVTISKFQKNRLQIKALAIICEKMNETGPVGFEKSRAQNLMGEKRRRNSTKTMNHVWRKTLHCAQL